MADPAKLQRWFEGLASRTLDLVGDYAGDELFIIEGDSLLLQCFSDKSLDFVHGLQLQHATFLVEKFIAQLHQRKCVFHIVFFSEHSRICVPPNTAKGLWSKYYLGREAIIQHLVQYLPTTVSSIQVRRFASYKSVDFGQYLNSVGAYFLMCHDGAAASDYDNDVPSDNEDLSPSDGDANSGNAFSNPGPAKYLLRSMIHWFVLHGYNIAILNSLECRDSKVLSMVLEDSMSRAKGVYDFAAAPHPNSKTLSLPHSSNEQRLNDKIQTIARDQILGLTQREWATILALGRMFQRSSFNSGDLRGAYAILLHTIILRECKLSERAIAPNHHKVGERFLAEYAAELVNVLTSDLWRYIVKLPPDGCNLGDCVDGGLFLETLRVLEQNKSTGSFSSTIRERFGLLIRVVSKLFEVDLGSTLTPDLAGSVVNSTDTSNEHFLECRQDLNTKNQEPPSKVKTIRVLPFSNRIIDAHLRPVSVRTADIPEEAMSTSMSRTFQELSHWHNHKRPLNSRQTASLTEWQKVMVNKRNQFFMADVQRYAASLTNAVGGSLEPESVFVKRQQKRNHKLLKSISQDQMRAGEASGRASRLPFGRKNMQHGKPSVRDQAEEYQRSKQEQAVKSHFAAWRRMVLDFEKELDYCTRYTKVQQYFSALSTDKRSAIRLEVLAYLTSTLVLAWKERCDTERREHSMHIVALIWHTVQEIAKAKHGLTRQIAECMEATVKVLNLPRLDIPRGENRDLSFNFAILNINMANTYIGLSPTEFQLVHAGPYMDRSMGSAADPRVHDFEPDKWQREVLDEIDARKSLFVVAPTSAGKTFISFYAMKQILEDDDDGVLVYVAPTKALVNQIAAEVQARSLSLTMIPLESRFGQYTREITGLTTQPDVKFS